MIFFLKKKKRKVTKGRKDKKVYQKGGRIKVCFEKREEKIYFFYDLKSQTDEERKKEISIKGIERFIAIR